MRSGMEAGATEVYDRLEDLLATLIQDDRIASAAGESGHFGNGRAT